QRDEVRRDGRVALRELVLEVGELALGVEHGLEVREALAVLRLRELDRAPRLVRGLEQRAPARLLAHEGRHRVLALLERDQDAALPARERLLGARLLRRDAPAQAAAVEQVPAQRRTETEDAAVVLEEVGGLLGREADVPEQREARIE